MACSIDHVTRVRNIYLAITLQRVVQMMWCLKNDNDGPPYFLKKWFWPTWFFVPMSTKWLLMKSCMNPHTPGSYQSSVNKTTDGVSGWLKGRSDKNIILLHLFSSFSFSSEKVFSFSNYFHLARQIWYHLDLSPSGQPWKHKKESFLGRNTSCCPANQEFWASSTYHLSSLGQSPKVGLFWRASLSH